MILKLLNSKMVLMHYLVIQKMMIMFKLISELKLEKMEKKIICWLNKVVNIFMFQLMNQQSLNWTLVII